VSDTSAAKSNLIVMPRKQENISRECSVSILRERIHSNILALADNICELEWPPATESMVFVLLSILEDFCERAIATGAASSRTDGQF
jgi:hypothetical protein